MKKFFTLMFALMLTTALWAQSCPHTISYQAVVRNAANELVTNTSDIEIKIEVLSQDLTETFYIEIDTVTSNQNGLISCVIGDETGISGTLDDIEWPAASFRITVTIPGESPVTTVTPVIAVPYSLYACEINPNGKTVTAIYDKMESDSIALHKALIDTANAIRNSIGSDLSNYYTKTETDNIFESKTDLPHDVITYVNDTLLANTELTQNIVKIINDTMNVKSDLTQSIVKVVSDTLGNGNSALNHIVDTIAVNNMKSELANGNSDVNKAVDTIVVNNVLEGLGDNNSAINNAVDTIVENHIANFDNELCDKVANCVEGNTDLRQNITNLISDTIMNVNNSLTQNIIKLVNDTLISNTELTQNIVKVINDTMNVKSDLTQSIVKVVSDTLGNGNSALNHIVDTIVVNNVLEGLGDNSSAINNAVDTIVENHIANFDNELCDKVANCVEGNTDLRQNITNLISDTIMNVNNSLTQNIIKLVNDTLKGNTELTENVVKVISDTLGNGNSALNHIVDTIAVNNMKSELANGNSDVNKAVDTIVVNNVLEGLGDNSSAINNAVDTIVENHIADFNNELCDKVAECVKDNQDLRQNITNLISDTIMNVNNSLTQNIIKLVNDTLKGNTELTENVVKVISDTLGNGNSALNHIVDTIAVNNMKSELANGNSDVNHAIDTIVDNHIKNAADSLVSVRELKDSLNNLKIKDCDDIMACDGIKTMRDSIQINANKIYSDSVALHTALKDTASAIRSAITTDLSNYYTKDEVYNKTEVDNKISDEKITVMQGTVVITEFSLNQSSKDTIMIPTPAEQAQANLAETSPSEATYVKGKEVIEKIVRDSLAISTSTINHVIDTIVENHIANFNNELCDKVADCVEGNTDLRQNITNLISDTIMNVNNSLTQNIIKLVNDTLKGNTELTENVVKVISDTLGNGNSALNHIVDTIAVNNMKSELANGNSDVNKAVDTIVVNNVLEGLGDNSSAINNAIDTIVENHIANFNNELCDKVADCVEGNTDLRQNITNLISDTIMNVNNSLTQNIIKLVNDTLKGNTELTENVVKVISDTLGNGNSALNHIVDTIVVNNVLEGLGDNSSAINNAVDTIVENHIADFNNELCDKVANCVEGNTDLRQNITNLISDTIMNVNNSLTQNIIKLVNDTLISNTELTENVVKVISDTLGNGNSALNHIVDTIAVNNMKSELANGNSDVNHAIDTIVDNRIKNAADSLVSVRELKDSLANLNIKDCEDVINCVDAKLADGSSTTNMAIDTIINNHLTDMLTCDNIATKCSNVVLKNAENVFAEDNTFNGKTTFTDTVIVPSAISSTDSSFSTADPNQAVNVSDLEKYLAKAIRTMENQTSYETTATAEQVKFTVTIPSGYSSINADTRLVQLYINGVYVGDSKNGVVTVSGTEITYVPSVNKDYKLVANDRIQIVYWVLK